jgi:hypothetical protein
MFYWNNNTIPSTYKETGQRSEKDKHNTTITRDTYGMGKTLWNVIMFILFCCILYTFRTQHLRSYLHQENAQAPLSKLMCNGPDDDDVWQLKCCVLEVTPVKFCNNATMKQYGKRCWSCVICASVVES